MEVDLYVSMKSPFDVNFKQRNLLSHEFSPLYVMVVGIGWGQGHIQLPLWEVQVFIMEVDIYIDSTNIPPRYYYR